MACPIGNWSIRRRSRSGSAERPSGGADLRLLAPNKGIETIIEALPTVVERHPNLLYVVLGATHPNLVAHEGERYRDSLKALAAEKGVSDNLALVDGFVEHDALIDYLQAADILCHALSQPGPDHLGHAVLCGRRRQGGDFHALCPATEILADGHGVLVDFRDSAAFAREIDRLLSNDRVRHRLSQRAYSRVAAHDLAAPGGSDAGGDRGRDRGASQATRQAARRPPPQARFSPRSSG